MLHRAAQEDGRLPSVMTDEQFGDLLEALTVNPVDDVAQYLVPVATLLIGYGLSRLQGRSDRKQAAADENAAARRDASREAMAHTARALSAPRTFLEDHARELEVQRAPVEASLAVIDADVARWWVRQIDRLLTARMLGPWNEVDVEARTAIANAIVQRLNAWANGRESGTEFVEAKDSAWAVAAGVPEGADEF